MERRKVTYKLYPNDELAARCDAWVRLLRTFKAALMERVEAYRIAGKSVSYYDQQNVLPQIKADLPELVRSKPDRRRASPETRPANDSLASATPIRPA